MLRRHFNITHKIRSEKMNSKTIIKRTLPLIIVLVVIIVFAISCSAFSKAKKVPGIENGEEAF